MEFEGFFEVGQGLLFGLALAGHVDFEALGNVPVPFTPDGCGERSRHGLILPQDDTNRRIRRMGEGSRRGLERKTPFTLAANAQDMGVGLG